MVNIARCDFEVTFFREYLRDPTLRPVPAAHLLDQIRVRVKARARRLCGQTVKNGFEVFPHVIGRLLAIVTSHRTDFEQPSNKGCLTLLGIAPWDHIVGLGRIELRADGGFQARERGLRPWWEVAAEA